MGRWTTGSGERTRRKESQIALLTFNVSHADRPRCCATRVSWTVFRPIGPTVDNPQGTADEEGYRASSATSARTATREGGRPGDWRNLAAEGFNINLVYTIQRDAGRGTAL